MFGAQLQESRVAGRIRCGVPSKLPAISAALLSLGLAACEGARSEAWGEPVQGIQLRLALTDQTRGAVPCVRFQTDGPCGPPRLTMYLRNIGPSPSPGIQPWYAPWLYVDGVRYGSASGGTLPGPVVLLPNGPVFTRAIRWQSVLMPSEGKPLDLAAGRHAIGIGMRFDGQQLLMSNTLVVETTSPETRMN